MAPPFFPFFNIMQYLEISNAFNCFRSRIKHYLSVRSRAFLFLQGLEGGDGVCVKFTQSIRLGWKKGHHFYLFIKILSPRGFHRALWDDHRSRLSAFRLLYCTTYVLTVTLLLLYEFELLKYITPYLRSAKEQYFVP